MGLQKIKTKINMCKESINTINATPYYNQTNGELERHIIQVTTDLGMTNLLADGLEFATSTTTVDDKKSYEVTLKVVTDSTLPKAFMPTPLNHVFSLTSSEATTLGIDETTKITFKYTLDGSPVVVAGKTECWIDYFCGCVKCMTTRSSRHLMRDEYEDPGAP